MPHTRHTSRHKIQPLPRALTAREGDTPRRGVFAEAWSRLDRVQELGADGEAHSGCVNALSWSDDGGILLSGSDDKRICIWTADTRPTSPSADVSPHPLRLSQTIITGHRQNIFSARFLPNANTPTIVSCAGDRDVRVFEVERLQPADSLDARVRRARGALWGVEGPGWVTGVRGTTDFDVRVLRCHSDRTKRIATEASPSLFLTVSEDGTVRQHDLRRPHECREECPDPLFRAPAGVDLYSLSISPLTPHLFAVAGQTDCAYICDRRMPAHQTPSWGAHTRRAEQVTCVRRLVLPDSEWERVERRNRLYSERHITCVKMSPDNAGEVICAFARHSTSLFSLNDSPAESSARVKHNSVVAPGPNSNTRRAEREESASGPRTRSATARAAETAAGAPKRRISNLSRPESRPTARQRTDSDPPVSGPIPSAAEFLRSPPSSPPRRERAESTSSSPVIAPIPERESRPLGEEWEEGPDEVMDLSEFAQRRLVGDEEGDDVDEDDDMDMDIDEENDDDFEGEDDFDGEDIFEDSDDDDLGMYRPGARSGEGEFRGVDALYPRRSFRGARNVDTVKDCNFLGDRSDKVASGSDDGNWFVWDKASGKLEGIWRGDSDIVNVMEQHPTLPLVAVSGIDNTVKMFAPITPQRGRRSYNRTAHADRIITDNLRGPTYRPASIVPNASAIHFIQSMMRSPHAAANRETVLELFRSIGIVPMMADSDDDDAEGEGGEGASPHRDGEEGSGEGEGGSSARTAGSASDGDDDGEDDDDNE